MIIVIGQPRRKLLRGLDCRARLPDVHDTNAVEPERNEIMLVNVRERECELQHQGHQREIGSAALGEAPYQR